jgi:hypothetical protein
MCTYIKEKTECPWCKRRVGLKMRKKDHCNDYPFCDGYHARSEYRRLETCDDCERNRGRPKQVDESQAPWNQNKCIVL